jgi:hypothetical protein
MTITRRLFVVLALSAIFSIMAYGAPLIFLSLRKRELELMKEQKELSETLRNQLCEMESMMSDLSWTDGERQNFFKMRLIQATNRGGITSAYVYRSFIHK